MIDFLLYCMGETYEVLSEIGEDARDFLLKLIAFFLMVCLVLSFPVWIIPYKRYADGNKKHNKNYNKNITKTGE